MRKCPKQVRHILQLLWKSTLFTLGARLLTGFGLDFLAEKSSGPDVDTATLQLVSVLLVSVLLPGFAVGAPALTKRNTETKKHERTTLCEMFYQFV
eukprot:5691230-Amphidinium_carterae.1